MWYDPQSGAWKDVGLEDLDQVAAGILEKTGNRTVWLFHGEMGSGKTTFIKAVCRCLGVKEAMSSPTFSIVNEYLTTDGRRIYHFDFYRIKDEAEAFDIGSEEYFYSGDLCLIEWPEKIPSLVPEHHVDVYITVQNENQRTIALSVHGGKEEKRIRGAG